MTTTTAADTLAVLKLLARRRSIDFVADATSLSLKAVMAVAEEHGWPDHTKVQTAVDELTRGASTGIPERTPEPPLPPAPPVRQRPVHASPAGEAPIPNSLSTPASRRDVNGANGAPHEASKSSTSLLTSPPAPGVDEIVRACRRSESKRIQALGIKLADAAEKATSALREEREKAEAKAKQAEEFAAKKAEVDRLKQQLADAQAKLRELKPSGVTEAALDFACNDCGDVFSTSSGRARHITRKHTNRSAT